MQKCKNCKKIVKQLVNFRDLRACEECCDQAAKEEIEFRRQNYNMDGEIDYQREMSEGCLDEYLY